jgi:signal transduction histidine kinase
MTAAARAMQAGDYSQRVRATARDEVGELAGAFNRMAADLAAADQQRRELIANVSHELRTPIAAVRSAAETVRRTIDKDPEAAARFVDMIERNACRLQELVEDLLELSRIESKQARFEAQAVDIAPVVEQVLSLFREPVERKRQRALAAPAESLPAVLGDRRAIEQVLTNMVENAVKYCPDGATITVRASEKAASGNPDARTVRIAVEEFIKRVPEFSLAPGPDPGWYQAGPLNVVWPVAK